MSKRSYVLLSRVILCVLVLLTVSPAVRADNFTWTLRTTPVSAIWEALAASSDCQKIAIGGENTYIYTSTDGGASWTERTGSGNRIWLRMASSADGNVLAAGAYNGYIYTSTDGGANWTERTGAGTGYWNKIASTSNASKLVTTNGSAIYVSTDTGATWSQMTGAGSRSWQGIDISPDGTKLAAAVWGGYVYTSSDGGTNWIARSSIGSQSWLALAASSDNKNIVVGGWSSYVNSSSDSGNTWTQQTGVGSAWWWDAASSADGNTMAITQNYPNGYVWTTLDGGSSWVSETNPGSRTWWGVVSSSDGTKLVASYSGYVYTGTTDPSSAPTVTTSGISSITSTTASGGGNVTDDGGDSVTVRGVCWNTSANPTTSDSKTSDGAGTGTFTSSLTSLTPGTLYHVRAYATNSVGTSYGGDTTFTTLTTPTVTTTTVTSITSTTASGGGNVTSAGGTSVTARGVCWSTSANPTTSDSKTTDGTGTGTFTSSLTSLTPGTLYHVRAYATNSVGTSYGGDSTLTTLTTPTVTTATITSITSTTASSGGNVTSDGGASVTTRGVCWSTSANPTTSDSKTTNGTGTGTFTSNLTSLTPGTLYHVRAYATNSVGTSYGGDSSFTTSTTTPTVTTTAVTSITSATASSGGNVTSDGGDSVTARGVCWSTSTNPTVFDNHTTNGTGTGSFTSSLTGLTSDTTYYVRAYATNSVGTGYGSQVSFITLRTHTISGYLLTSDSTGIDSVLMDGLPGDPLTDFLGYYTATVDSGWSGTVKPIHENYAFDPESTSYSDVAGDEETDYMGTFSKLIISGYVRQGGEGVEGVVMNGLPGNPPTDSTGYYSAMVDSGSHWTVVPTQAGCTFQPDNRIYTAVSSDQANQDFIEYCFSEGIDEDKDKSIPKEYQLSQNQPNPFNPSTEIKFGIPQNSHVTLRIYNIMGQEVITLLDRNLSAGTYHIRWNGADGSGRTLSSGVYFYRMQAGDYVQTKQMLLLK